MRNLLTITQKAADTVIQWLFPLRCPVCDSIVTPYGNKICTECVGKLKLLTPPWCLQCGKKLTHAGEYCEDCRRKKHKYIRGRALYEYGSVKMSVYRLKYGGRAEYADFFGYEISRHLGDFIREVNPDALVPVPLHKKRMRKRGYNQAQLIAEAVGRYTDIPVRNKLLVRVKNTRPLKTLNPSERQNNLKKAFNISENDVKLKTIIIIDDIYTTGSTIDEAAEALKESGVKDIYFITLACGVGI
jgi:ComF family protein